MGSMSLAVTRVDALLLSVLLVVFVVLVVFMWGVFMQFKLIFVLLSGLCSLRPVSLFFFFFLHVIKNQTFARCSTSSPTSEPPGVLLIWTVLIVSGV